MKQEPTQSGLEMKGMPGGSLIRFFRARWGSRSSQKQSSEIGTRTVITNCWRLTCYVILLCIMNALNQQTFASTMLQDITKQEVNIFRISGEIKQKNQKAVTIRIEFEDTSIVRRGMVQLVATPDGTTTAKWHIEPSRPLIVEFSLPKEDVNSAYIVLYLSRKEDIGQEIYHTGYFISLSGKLIFGSDNPIKEKAVPKAPAKARGGKN
jgi:hypothetical protein